MRKIFLLLVLIACSSSQHFLFAQKKKSLEFKDLSPAQQQLRADQAYKSYSEACAALSSYHELKRKDERNVFYTYKLAETYRLLRDYVPAAKYYAEAYELSRRVYPYSAFYAGLMYKQQGEYQMAKVYFNKFLKDNKKIAAAKPEKEKVVNDPDYKLIPKEVKEIKKLAALEIAGCDMAMDSIKYPNNYNVINCGPNVNTERNETAPYPLGDTALMFIANWPEYKGRILYHNSNYSAKEESQYDNSAKFYYSHKQEGFVDSFQWPMTFNEGFRKWNQNQSLDYGENTSFNAYRPNPYANTGSGCYSTKGDKFYFTKCFPRPDTAWRFQCKIYVSEWRHSHWDLPMVIPNDVNEMDIKRGQDGKIEYYPSSKDPCYALVGKKEVLFFSSNRKTQSRGGWDIWFSVIDPRNETYSRPKNCGKMVNTKFDEVSPYFDTRDSSLYFSSNGRKSFGGFDIFKAKTPNGRPSKFEMATNMGYPINSPADEFYFILDPVGKPDGYVVSNRIGTMSPNDGCKGPTCCDDIWRVQREPRLIVKGTVIDRKTQQLVTQAVVKMIDQKGEMVSYHSEDGNFIFYLRRHHSYVLTGDKLGYTSSHNAVSTMDVKRSDPDDTVHITVVLDTVKNDFKVSNIYYDYRESTIRPESIPALDSVVTFLKDNPSISVEIYSFTDNTGTPEFNKALSQRRAQSVVDYLEKNQVDRSRMKAIGFGNSNPVASEKDENGNDNPLGRQKNRRTEFRIIGDLPTRRVLYNSAQKGSMNQQMENLKSDTIDDEDGTTVPNTHQPKDKDED